jgi:soluble cytochrome b562
MIPRTKLNKREQISVLEFSDWLEDKNKRLANALSPEDQKEFRIQLSRFMSITAITNGILGGSINLSPGTIARWRSGHRSPLLPARRRLLKYLETLVSPEADQKLSSRGKGPNFENINADTVSIAFSASRRHLVVNRVLVMEHAGAVKDLASALQDRLQSLRLNDPEAGRAQESLGELVVAIDDFTSSLQNSDDEAATDKAQGIYWRALLHTLEDWYNTPAGNVTIKTTLATVALSLASVCGVTFVGEAVVGAAVIGSGPVEKLIKSFRGILPIKNEGEDQLK